ncbi:hypothetical protein D3C81_1505330 [compost metagenome]
MAGVIPTRYQFSPNLDAQQISDARLADDAHLPVGVLVLHRCAERHRFTVVAGQYDKCVAALPRGEIDVADGPLGQRQTLDRVGHFGVERQFFDVDPRFVSLKRGQAIHHRIAVPVGAGLPGEGHVRYAIGGHQQARIAIGAIAMGRDPITGGDQ